MNQNTDPQHGQTIAVMLTKLASHYYRADFGPGQVKHLILDYVEDLREYDLQDLQTAIKAYRRDVRSKGFPKVGVLRKLCEDAAYLRKPRNTSVDTSGQPEIGPEFGESRPYFWEYMPKRFWKPHWCVDDLNTARDPNRRADYDRWVARTSSSAGGAATQ